MVMAEIILIVNQKLKICLFVLMIYVLVNNFFGHIRMTLTGEPELR